MSLILLMPHFLGKMYMNSSLFLEANKELQDFDAVIQHRPSQPIGTARPGILVDQTPVTTSSASQVIVGAVTDPLSFTSTFSFTPSFAASPSSPFESHAMLPLFGNLTLFSKNGTSADDDVLRRTAGELVVGTLTFAVITLMTVGGNTLVILSVFTYRPLNKVQNYFLVSLAASDLAVAVLVTPFNVVKFIVGEWMFGVVFCQFWLTCDILCCTASILNLCAIALDRYWAIHDPIAYASKRTLKLVLSMIAVVWALSVLISVPPLIGWNDWNNDRLRRTCELTTQREFVVYSACGSFFIPLIVMTTVYAKIFYAARQRLRNKRRSFKGLSMRSRLDEKSVPRVNRNPEVGQSVQTPAGEPTALDPTTSSLAQTGASPGDGQSSTISPVTPGSELSERTILLKEQQNGNTAECSWGALKANAAAGPLRKESPRPAAFRRLKKSALSDLHKTNFQSRESSVRSTRDREDEKSSTGPGLVQKYIKDRERISVTKEKKAAKTLAVIMGVFVLCWLPFFVMYIVKPFIPSNLLHPKVEEAITWLGYINSAINPVIYTIFNLDFRRAFQKFLCPFRLNTA